MMLLLWLLLSGCLLVNSDSEKDDSLRSRRQAFKSVSQERCRDLLLKYAEQSFIYLGRRAFAGEFRYMAVLGYGDRKSPEWSCGGTLVTETHVLTAAHCLTRRQPTVIRLGDLDLSKELKGITPQDFTMKNMYIHPDYKPPVRYHDIAIIELDRKVKRTSYIDIACVDTNRTHNETLFTITGWGQTEFGSSPSPELLAADVKIFSNEECRKRYKADPRTLPNGIIDDIMICAGGKSDTCYGDSGGPLAVKSSRHAKIVKHIVHDVIGVTSFGRACGITPDPGVYTRVSYYVPWIESIIWNNGNIQQGSTDVNAQINDGRNDDGTVFRGNMPNSAGNRRTIERPNCWFSQIMGQLNWNYDIGQQFDDTFHQIPQQYPHYQHNPHKTKFNPLQYSHGGHQFVDTSYQFQPHNHGYSQNQQHYNYPGYNNPHFK